MKKRAQENLAPKIKFYKKFHRFFRRKNPSPIGRFRSWPKARSPMNPNFEEIRKNSEGIFRARANGIFLNSVKTTFWVDWLKKYEWKPEKIRKKSEKFIPKKSKKSKKSEKTRKIVNLSIIPPNCPKKGLKMTKNAKKRASQRRVPFWSLSTREYIKPPQKLPPRSRSRAQSARKNLENPRKRA